MPTRTNALATVYARSLFDLAQQAGGQDKINEVVGELEQIQELLDENSDFREFFASPVVDSEKRSKSITRIFENRITDLTLRFLLVLNDKGRLNEFSSVAAAFDQLV